MNIGIGTVVVIRGLTQATQLNGRYGKIAGIQNQRLVVDLEESGDLKALRPENCKLPIPVRSWCHSCQVAAVASHTAKGELVCPQCCGTFVEAAPTSEELQEASSFPTGDASTSQGIETSRRRPVRVMMMPAPYTMMLQGFDVFEPRSEQMGFGLWDPAMFHVFETMFEEQPSGPPPASVDAINRLEKMTINDAHESHDCPVCQENLAEGDTATRMPCGHVFHSDCLTPWLSQHNTCPMCRHELPTDDPDYEQRRQ